MRSVTIEVLKADLGARMAGMRTWLDDRGVAPSRFRCTDLQTGKIAIRVEFEKADQAEAFAAAFNREEKISTPALAMDVVQQPITRDQDNTSADQREPAILVVDDEPDVRQLVCDILSYEGFKIMEAGSSTEALYRLRSDTRIDLLFTDIVIPGEFDGFELAQRVKKFRPDLPIIYVSGYVKDFPPEKLAFDNGVMLRKPFANQTLIAEVRRALDQNG